MNAEDRELLELAAKAAGVKDFVFCAETGAPFDAVGYWNPLEDDGDALRLFVNISRKVYSAWLYAPDEDSDLALVRWIDNGCIEKGIGIHQDPCAATRRAIVRAAAEIGRQMP